MKAAGRVRNWKSLSQWLLGYFNIKHDHGSDEDCLKAVVEAFLLGEGRYQPSWRRLIFSLDAADESHLSDQIRSYGERVQGESTCMFESGVSCVYMCE